MDATTPPEAIGAYKRYVEWERSINRLASILPASIRGTVRPLVTLTPDLELVMPQGRRIADAERVRRLKADCQRRLTRAPISERDADAERQRIKYALAFIDCGRPPLVRVPHREHTRPVPVGSYVTTSATQAVTLGRLSSFPSQLGYPILGIQASQLPGGQSLVEPAPPPRLPRVAAPYRFHAGVLDCGSS